MSNIFFILHDQGNTLVKIRCIGRQAWWFNNITNIGVSWSCRAGIMMVQHVYSIKQHFRKVDNPLISLLTDSFTFSKLYQSLQGAFYEEIVKLYKSAVMIWHVTEYIGYHMHHPHPSGWYWYSSVGILLFSQVTASHLEIRSYLIFKWVAVTWHRWDSAKIVVPTMVTRVPTPLSICRNQHYWSDMLLNPRLPPAHHHHPLPTHITPTHFLLQC